MRLKLLQLYLLVWKCWKTESRNKIRITLQIIWPLFLFIILVVVRITKNLRFPQGECHFDAKPLPSAGLLPFIQGFICTFNNTCYNSKTPSENTSYPFGQVPLVGLLRETADVLKVANRSGLIDTLPNDLRVFQDFAVILLNDSASTHMNFSDLYDPRDLSDIENGLVKRGLPRNEARVLMTSHLNGPGMASILTSQEQTDDSAALDRFFDIAQGRSQLTGDEICNTNIVTIVLRPPDGQSQNSLKQLQSALCDLDNRQLNDIGRFLRSRVSLRSFVPKFRRYMSAETGLELLTEASQLRQFRSETADVFSDGSSVRFLRDLSATFNLTQMNLTSGPLARIAPFWYPLCNRPFPTDELKDAFKSFTKNLDTADSTQPTIDDEDTQNETKICREMKFNQTYDNSTSCSCNVFLLPVQKIAFLWRMVRPVLKGRVLYYPNTPLVRRIMQQVQQRVDLAGQLSNLLGTIIDLADRVRANYADSFALLREYEPLLRLVESVDESDVLDDFDFINPNVRRRINRNETQNAIDQFFKLVDRVNLTDIFYVQLPYIRSRIDCFITPDRFQAVDDVDTLILGSMSYAKDDALWAAIQFYDAESLNKTVVSVDNKTGNATVKLTVPHLMRYAIRMEPDMVDSTSAIKDRPSKVSGRRDPFRDLKYFTSGFIYLQDAIDKAIIRVHRQALRTQGGNRTLYLNEVERQLSPLVPKASTIGTIMQQFPYPCYVEDAFLQTLGRQLTLYIVLGWIYQAAMIVKSVVLEKERKLREVARIMGISPGLHFLSWKIFWIIVMLITVILFVIIVVGGRVLMYSSPGILFLIMMAYSMATISFCFFLSSFFNRANIAAVVGGLVYFLTYIVYGAIASFPDTYTVGRMSLASLLPNIALSFAWEVVGEWELKTEGSTAANFAKPITADPSDAFTVAHAFVMLIIDTFLYYFLAWYIDQIFPGEYGVPRPWYFVFMPSYWCESSSSSSNNSGPMLTIGENLDNLDGISTPVSEDSPNPSASFANPSSRHQNNSNGAVKASRLEAEPKHLPIGCSIRNLVKVYEPGIFTKCAHGCRVRCRNADDEEHSREVRPAVDNLSLNMYEGQITALLGHNGAGKTTTMSIMTGLIPASSGTVTIKGLDVVKDVDKVRRMTGFCPQFNVLYDDLTVSEHLWFYGRMRDIPSVELLQEIETILKDTNLLVKKNERARHLSGGMRRRLSIAVAFIGNSKCVILDEPTAGVDPYARRQIWDLVAKFRKNRTIILSTHHMDEAEILSDRIAVMSQGRLQTCGTPLFLKQTFGDGYGLIVVRDVASFLKVSANKLANKNGADSGVHYNGSESDKTDYADSSEMDDSIRFHTTASSVLSDADRRHEELITAFVARFFNAYQVVEHVGHEIHYRIAYTDLPKFAEFFEALDAAQSDLCVSNYGLSDTSLEEIFIKIADETDVCEEQIEAFTEAGNLPRPVTRLSFRGRLRKTAMRVLHGKRSRSMDTLSASTDNLHQASEVASVSGSCPPPMHSLPQYEPVTGSKLMLMQFYALVAKRMHRTRRNFKGFVTEIILPAVFVLLGVILVKLRGFTPDNPPRLELHPWVLTPSSSVAADQRLYLFFGSINTTDPLTRQLRSAFIRSEYAGTRCMSSAANYTLDGYPCDVNVTINGVAVPTNESDWLQADRYRQRVCECQESGLQDCEDSSTLMSLQSSSLSRAVKATLTNRSIGGVMDPSYYPNPKYRRLRTTDDILNLTNVDIGQYIINQYSLLRQNFYGGFTFLVAGQGLNQSEADEYNDLLIDLSELTRDSFNRSFANNTRNFGIVKWRNVTPAIDNLRNRTRNLVNQTDLPARLRNISLPFTIRPPTLPARGRRQAVPVTTTTTQRVPFRNTVISLPPLPNVNRTAVESRINATMAKVNQSNIPSTGRDVIDWLRNASTLGNRTRIPIFGGNGTRNFTINIEDLQSFLESGLIAPAALQIWYNNKGWHSSADYNNYANNLLLRLAMSSDVNNPDNSFGIVTFNHPLNYTRDEFTMQFQRALFVDVLVAIQLILAMSFVPASFVVFLIEDRQSDSKHVQMVSGLKPFIYWLANYFWDCISYIIPCVLCLVIFAIFDVEAYVGNKSASALFILLLLYGFAVTPMLYPTSIFLGTPSTAFVLLACANLFIGSATTIATYMLDLLQKDDESLVVVNDILKNVFFIFPQYCLGRGLFNMAASYRLAQGVSFLFGTEMVHEPLQWKVCGQFFFALILHAVGWFLVNLLIEYGHVFTARIARCMPIKWRRANRFSGDKYKPANDADIPEDVDVAKERQAIESDLAGNLTLQVKNLSKFFSTSRGKLTAVDRLTFGVPVGQCFGLLGVNGAGKTTTFRMLTGHLSPTSGSATIHGFDMDVSRTSANKLIGYCPQADCITPLLSGRENLEFFARLRGVPESLVKQVAEFNITRMDLRRHADKPARHYSGGNKRKLSVAISLTGEPPLVFLDEPTAGIDPRARRFLWRAIAQLLVHGQSVVLTTHSMDECEALCTRLAIMVNGRFRCLGSPQHLKARFGEGYFVSIRFAVGTVDAHRVSKAADALRARFPDTQLKEWHDTVATFAMGGSGSYRLKLGQVFAFLRDPTFTSEMNIVDFSVTQSSLDAVFVSFAKTQSTELADADRDAASSFQHQPGAGFHNKLHENSNVTVRSFAANGSAVESSGFENPLYEQRA